MIAALYNEVIPSSTDTSAVLLTDTKTEQKTYNSPVFTFKSDDGVYRTKGNKGMPNRQPI